MRFVRRLIVAYLGNVVAFFVGLETSFLGWVPHVTGISQKAFAIGVVAASLALATFLTETKSD